MIKKKSDEINRKKAIAQDTTDLRKRSKPQMEAALEAFGENEANLTALIENTKDRIWAVDADYRLIVSNPQFLQEVKEERKRELVLGKSVLLDSLPQAVCDEWRSYYDRALLGESFHVEKELQFCKEAAFIDYHFHPIRSTEGKIRGVVVSGRDITKHKRVENDLQTLSSRNQAMLEAIPDIIMEMDTNKVYTWANHAGIEFFGDNVIGQEANYYFEGEQQAHQAVIPIFSNKEEVIYVESWQRRRDGEKRLLAWWYRVLKDGSGNVSGALSSARDITEPKRVEEALRQSEVQLQVILESTADGILAIDNMGKVMKTNKRFAELWQIPQNIFATGDDNTLLKYVLDQLVNPEEFLAKVRLLYQSTAEDSDMLVFKDGRIFERFSAPLFLSDSSIGRVWSFRDVTERERAKSQKEAALEDVRQKAKELQEKNEELDRFTYSVAHDLKSPLVTICTFLGILEKDTAAMDKEKIKQDIGYIRIGAEKMSKLFDELLDLSRIGRSPNLLEAVSLQNIVQEALGLVAGRITERKVNVQVTEEPIMLTGERVRLVEVFQNLLDNACKFMGEQKSPLVEIGVETKGDEAIIYVRDNGMGIPLQFLSKLFIMFEKLNHGSEGDGIGLALVKRIIEVHGGRIWVESEGPDQGTTFYFSLAKTRLQKTKENQ